MGGAASRALAAAAGAGERGRLDDGQPKKVGAVMQDPPMTTQIDE